MKVLITGENGFIAKNLKIFLKERSDIKILKYSKNNKTSELEDIIDKVDFIFHLAGVNRSENLQDFTIGNENLTYELCEAIRKTNKKIPVIYSSSIQADLNNPYGVSKLKAENLLFNLLLKSSRNGWSFSSNSVLFFRFLVGALTSVL